MSEAKVQDSVQEMTTQGQNTSGTDNRDSELLREVMQKKERLNSAMERAETLQSKYDGLQQQNADEKEYSKTNYNLIQQRVDREDYKIGWKDKDDD